jgi:hypothetical protein
MADVNVRKMEGLSDRSRPVPSPAAGVMDFTGDASNSSSTESPLYTPGTGNSHFTNVRSSSSPLSLIEHLMNGSAAGSGASPDRPVPASTEKVHVHDAIFSSTIPPSQKPRSPSLQRNMPLDFTQIQQNQTIDFASPGSTAAPLFDQTSGADFNMSQMMGQFETPGNIGMGNDFGMMQEMMAMGWGPGSTTGLTPIPIPDDLLFDNNNHISDNQNQQ